jgi:hypothetical protein
MVGRVVAVVEGKLPLATLQVMVVSTAEGRVVVGLASIPFTILEKAATAQMALS